MVAARLDAMDEEGIEVAAVVVAEGDLDAGGIVEVEVGIDAGAQGVAVEGGDNGLAGFEGDAVDVDVLGALEASVDGDGEFRDRLGIVEAVVVFFVFAVLGVGADDEEAGFGGALGVVEANEDGTGGDFTRNGDRELALFLRVRGDDDGGIGAPGLAGPGIVLADDGDGGRGAGLRAGREKGVEGGGSGA